MPEPLVLAVDDQPLFLKLIEAALSESGYIVLSFNDPQDALEELQQGLRPNVIISDVSMPDMDGFEFYLRVRDISELRAVPFLFLTALGDREYLRRGMSLGADDYVTKPFSKQDLVDAVSIRLQRIAEIRQPLSGVVQVSAFGTPEVIKDGERLEFDSRKALELFLFLLENRDGVSTFEVAEALWPKKNETKASSSFHTTLYRLRKALKGDFVETTNRRYYIQRDLTVNYDVQQYRDAAERAKQNGELGDVRQAMGLYGKDYLVKFDADWAEDCRDALRNMHRSLLLHGVSVAEQSSNLEQATLIATELTTFEPYDYSHWETLAELWRARGNTTKASEVLEEFDGLMKKSDW
ncbi:MAG: response regulator [Deinococcota bacterium]